MLKKVLFSGLLVAFHQLMFAQITTPPTPKPHTFQPIDVTVSKTTAATPKQTAMVGYNANVPTQYTEQQKVDREQQTKLTKLLEEVNNSDQRKLEITFPSQMGRKGANYYASAAKGIRQMLNGEKPLSIKDAVFEVENAYLENELDQTKYNNAIKQLVLISRNVLKSNTNLDALTAIERAMTDTLKVQLPSVEKPITSYPFRYDFKDFFAYDDWTQMFVSKAITTRSGQCHSLPLLYMILAEELNANAFLSFSPSHSFVKLYDSNRQEFNLELTNDLMISQKWLFSSGHLKMEAIQSGLYLDTLGRKKVVAQCLVDLAHGYSIKYGFDEFVLNCLNEALAIHPMNPVALSLKSDYYTVLFHGLSLRFPKKYNASEMKRNAPDAWHVYAQRNKMYALLDQSGYEHMPEREYATWLKQLETEAQQQYNKAQLQTLQQDLSK